MTFPILGGGALPAIYNINNSLRFNDDDSAYLSFDPSSSGTTGTWTASWWMKLGNLTRNYILSSGAVNQRGHIFIDSNNLCCQPFNSSGASKGLVTDAVLRDPSAWYHCVIVANGVSTSNISSNLKIYINGVELSTSASGGGTASGGDRINDAQAKRIGELAPDGGSHFDGYLSEFHFIDGTAKAQTDFGEFDDNGVWIPKEYDGTYGTNGWYLEFKQTGTSQNSSGMGADTSGEDNHWAVNNLAATDQCTDTPTNNFCTLNPLAIQYDNNGGSFSGMVHSEGNTQAMNNTASGWGATLGSILIPTSGKWYWELKNIPGDDHIQMGVMEHGYRPTTGAPLDSSGLGWGWYSNDGGDRQNGSNSATFNSWKDANDQAMIAYNANNGKLWLGKNGTWQTLSSNVGDPANDAYPHMTVDSVPVTPCLGTANISSGTGPSFNFGNPAYAISSGNADANGYGNFEYAPPSGFLALCSKNLSYSPINDPSAHFQTLTYTGNETDDTAITNTGNSDLQPDLLWIKELSQTRNHTMADSTRGVTKHVHSDLDEAEATASNRVKSFDSDGFTIGDGGYTNDDTELFAAWQWKANGGTTSSNTSGSITSTVQANTTAGFSIVTWTGTGSNATIGHGLGAVPEFILVRNRDEDNVDWGVYHAITGDEKYLELNTTDGPATAGTMWQDTSPTSTLFYIGTNTKVNKSTINYVAYCFAGIQGYSKFGHYIGNANTDGPFLNLGFCPAWIMIKGYSASADQWGIHDLARDPINESGGMNELGANSSAADYAGDANTNMDFVANGFKIRNIASGTNAPLAETYLYAAFAHSPFVTSTRVPATAR